MKSKIHEHQKNKFTRVSNKLILFAMIIGMFTACDKDDNNAPTYVAPQGVADITLTTTGGTEFKIAGPCGWAVAGGLNYIGANHATNNLKVFAATFNIPVLPTTTTSYTLVDDSSDEDPTHITMSLTEIVDGGFREWTSFDGSGTLTLVVEGNKVTANLAGINLEKGSGNLAPYNQNGALTGTLKFYR
jgi:hypothetical protein